MNKISDFTEELLSLISEDKLPQVIQTLSQLLKGSPQLNEFTLQSARYHDISRQIRNNTIDFEKANIEKNKIRMALMDILYQMEKGTGAHPAMEKELSDFLEKEKKSSPQISIKNTINGGNNHIFQGFSNMKNVQFHSGNGDNVGGDSKVYHINNSGANIGEQKFD